MVLLSTPIRFGTSPHTWSNDLRQGPALPAHIQLIHENGDSRDCDPLPIYSKVDTTILAIEANAAPPPVLINASDESDTSSPSISQAEPVILSDEPDPEGTTSNEEVEEVEEDSLPMIDPSQAQETIHRRTATVHPALCWKPLNVRETASGGKSPTSRALDR